MKTHIMPNNMVLTVMTIILCAVFSAGAIAKKGGGGNGGGNAGGGNQGDPEPVYSAAGDLISETVINSTNLSFDDIIFRPSADFTFNLYDFAVSDPDNGGFCPGFSSATTGTLVLAPGDSASPDSAELRFGFQGQLSGGGKTAQHYFVMQGDMDGNWPPTAAGTALTFTSWSISAENKRSQKSDCEGAGDGVVVEIDIWQSSP